MPTVPNIKTLTTDKIVAPARASILRVLAYFDIFQYPLRADEIREWVDQSYTHDELERSLAQLLNDGRIFLHQEFFSLHDNRLLAARRRAGNIHAEELIPRAERIGRFLQRFPFVRAVAVSGSLSKNFADDKADIDFFIITSANRLWIARTLLHLFKKFTFLRGRQHFYCMNYFIDEEAMLLADRNIFTAIEIRTLLPVTGSSSISHFFSENGWTDRFFPTCNRRMQRLPDAKYTPLKHASEWLMNIFAPNRIDDLLMRITQRRWLRKERRGLRNTKGQTMGLITGKHFARSNPGSFQEKVLARYKARLAELGLL